jgi:hypothetical protein
VGECDPSCPLDRSAEALDAADEVVARYRDDPAPALREQVARALVIKGGHTLDAAEVAAVADEAVVRYRDDPAPALRKLVGLALVMKGIALGELDRSAEAQAAYDEVVARYGDDPALRELVAQASMLRP